MNKLNIILDMYNNYITNFNTIKIFACQYGITESKARTIIGAGEILTNNLNGVK